ncbi:DEAD/DEAH box helicase [Georgenia halophila]|uniref:DEAD/DEAH box helicase n=1 Tax=Georgenia halophila TaxID=620889 RepID=A0ABP8LPL1_9MICO
MNVLAALTDDLLAHHFGPRTLARARGYVDRLHGRPSVKDLTNDAVTVTASVRGTEPAPYQVEFHADVGEPGNGTSLDGGWVASVCSCPVGSLCKHGAAVALVLRQTFVGTSSVPAWQRQLDALTGELASQNQPVATDELALQFSVRPPSRYSYSDAPSFGLQPVRRGAKRKWIKTGAGWSDLPTAIAQRRIHPGQVDALEALYLAFDAHGYGIAGNRAAPLQSFGHHLPRLLRDAEQAGIEFLTTGALRSVTVREEPLTLAADATSRGATTRLELGVAVDGEVWQGERLVLLGGPRPRTVALLDDGHLQIAALAAPVPSSALRLVEGGPIEVPAGDLDAFRDRLAGLVQHVDVRSPDGSVDVPQPLRPILRVTVTWRSATAAELEWSWCYGESRHCTLDSDDSLGGVRDHTAESVIVSSVPADVRGRAVAADGDALTLAIHDLPYLRELDDVEVTERHRPDFRAATEAPEVTFDVVEASEPTGDDPDFTDWLDLGVTITVAGESIPLPQVLAALTLGDDFLVLPSGLYLPTDIPELTDVREVVEAASQLRERDGDRISVGKHDLGVWAQLAEVGVVSRQAAQWVERAQALRDLTDIPQPEPEGLTCELRSYQLDGFWWLAFLYEHGLGGILADDMGLGKTLQVLALIQHARGRGTDEPFLVVAPTSVVTAWEHEASRHAPNLRVGVVRRRTDDVGAIAASSDVVLTTYTLLRLDQEAYAAGSWAGLVLDEAQQVKNHQSKTYAAARKIDAEFRLAVTGTPFENRLMELWALLSLTVPGLYPWPRQFTDRVVKPVEKDGDEAVLRRFRQRIRPFMLRRTKEVVAKDLPPKQEQILDVTLTPRHRKLYDAWLAKERQRILGLVADFDRNRMAIFSALTKLRQLALDPALVGEDSKAGSAKLDLLLEHVAELTAEGHRALVFSQFTSYLARVREGLEEAGIASTYLDGSTRDRGAVIEEFRSGAAPVFLISLKAGGSGLTLTEADYVFVLDPWWNPAAEAQAVDRVHRIGQHKNVHVYRLVAADTIEQKVMQLKARKAELFAQVIDGDGAASTAIDANDIRQLFAE